MHKIWQNSIAIRFALVISDTYSPSLQSFQCLFLLCSLLSSHRGWNLQYNLMNYLSCSVEFEPYSVQLQMLRHTHRCRSMLMHGIWAIQCTTASVWYFQHLNCLIYIATDAIILVLWSETELIYKWSLSGWTILVHPSHTYLNSGRCCIVLHQFLKYRPLHNSLYYHKM